MTNVILFMSVNQAIRTTSKQPVISRKLSIISTVLGTFFFFRKKKKKEKEREKEVSSVSGQCYTDILTLQQSSVINIYKNILNSSVMCPRNTLP